MAKSEAPDYRCYKLTVELEGADRPSTWHATIGTALNVEMGMVSLLEAMARLHAGAKRRFQVVGIQSLKREVSSDFTITITPERQMFPSRAVYEALGLADEYQQAMQALAKEPAARSAQQA